jgi:predicted RecB family nuclease
VPDLIVRMFPSAFVPSEKLSTDDKLMLALDAVAFSKVYGKTPRAGRIIHGRNHTMATITLSPLLGRIQRVLRAINDQQTKAAEPLLAIKKQCVECEFQARCRQIAMQKDDLSLLTTLSAKERTRHNEKGIFTVLQFFYTFRSPRRSASMPPKHQPALKALAIRKNQIHILGTPAFSLPSTPVRRQLLFPLNDN